MGSKSVYTRDANKKYTKIIHYQYDAETEEWKESGKTEYTYDQNGFLIKTQNYSYGTNGWNLSGQVLYTNNENGKPLITLNQSASGSTGDFKNTSRIENTYDSQGRILSYKWYSWTLSGQSDLFEECVQEFNAQGKLTKREETYHIIKESPEFDYKKTTEREYDNRGNMTKETITLQKSTGTTVTVSDYVYEK